MKKQIIILTLGLVLLASGAALAKLDPQEQSKVNTLAQTLKLDAGQKAKIELEREQSKKQLVQLENTWQSLHDQLRREVRRDQPNAAEVNRLSAALGKTRGEIIALRTNSLIYLKSLLSADQKQKIEDRQPDEAPVTAEPQGGSDVKR